MGVATEGHSYPPSAFLCHTFQSLHHSITKRAYFFYNLTDKGYNGSRMLLFLLIPFVLV